MIETGQTGSWFPTETSHRSVSLQLFCLPYAGGTANLFRLWPDDLPSNIGVMPVQLPARGSRYQEPPITQLDPLINALAEAIRPYLNLPYAIYGHSMGALIGFELAREVRRKYGVAPAHLYVAAYPVPNLPKPLPPIAHLPDTAFLAEIRRLGGTPQEVLENQKLIELYLPLLRADFKIGESYLFSPGAPLRCPISAFGGLEDHLVDRSGLAAWGEQTTSFFTVHMFPGNHFFLHHEHKAILKVIANTLSSYL